MITANDTVTCSHPLLFNFIRWHHASGWEQLIHAVAYAENFHGGVSFSGIG